MEEKEKVEKITPKHRDKIEALDNLSLGISMVAAVAIGFGIGYGLKAFFEMDWLLWLGVFWGLGAAGLNIYKGQVTYKAVADVFGHEYVDPNKII